MAEEINTREALLKAGLAAFATHGYDGVSVRTLAKAAGANVAAVGYHFGGKEEFYVAVAKHVVSQILPRMMPLRERGQELAQLDNFDPNRDSPKIAAFVSAFIEAILAEEMPEGCYAFMMREYAAPGPGFDILYEGAIAPMHEMVTGLYAMIRGLDPQDPVAVIGAHSLLGQWLFFRVAEEAVIRRLGWAGFDKDKAEQIKAVVVPSVMRSLGLPYDHTNLA